MLAGQSLIRAAELRAISTEYSRYVAATQSFRDKYFALPGDMTNAVAFWGTDPNGCPNNTVKTPRSQTCNGDGNGQIGNQRQSCCMGALNNEHFRFWQHLANAGLVEGSFSGVSDHTNSMGSLIHNQPRGKINNTGWAATFIGTVPSSGYVPGYEYVPGDYGNALLYGSVGTLVNSLVDYARISPEEMWNIDIKMDDGKPFLGRLRTVVGSSCEEFSPTLAQIGTVNYNLNTTFASGSTCVFVFANAF